MVAADVAAATLGEANIDKVMNGELAAPSTPKRDAIFEKLERATHSTESTVQIFLSMGQAVAVGTAIGSGLDPKSVAERARKSGEASRAGLEEDMRLPMRRFLAYSYRNLSDSDLKHLLGFLESPAGKRYVTAYNASMGAGFDAMGKRTGEQLGESLRELAQAQFDQSAQERAPPARGAARCRSPRRPRPRRRASLAQPPEHHRGFRASDRAPSSARNSLQQRADRFDLILQPVIRVEHVQRGAVLARPAHAVLHRHDVIVPAVHDDGRAGDVLRRVGFESRHVEGGRQQEQAARLHARGGGGGNVAPMLEPTSTTGRGWPRRRPRVSRPAPPGRRARDSPPTRPLTRARAPEPPWR